MANGIEKLPKLPKGASRAQTQEFLFQMFKQGHPPKLALESLKSAREIAEASRAFGARSERESRPPDRLRWRQEED
jgi:hypothetical protein